MRLYLFIIPVLIFSGCHSKDDSPASAARLAMPKTDSTDTAENFFPVTAYLKGEIAGIKKAGTVPFYKITSGNHTDSMWLKNNTKADSLFSGFLSPIIDSVSLKKMFIETKFLDQTVNAYTLTCDPVEGKADNFAFRHWDVYIDPDNNKVTRIYLLKQLPDNRKLQMTWRSGKWCKIVTLKTTGDDTQIEKVEKISWADDNEDN